ncbi:MAG: EboA domain-containing protein [Rubrivivax sp.]|nr:EboA domain-containing protein [Rubrivivax sp.]
MNAREPSSGPASPAAAALLQRWLEDRLDAAGTQWLREAVAGVAADAGDRALFRSVSLVSRRLGKAALAPGAAALAEADQARPGWDPSTWTLDQAARVLLLLAGGRDADGFVHRLDQLCATADLDELVAFHRGLPLYPFAERHRQRAAEGLRSNMRPVFEAVAHRNPYPGEQLSEPAWNQMVLKALFVGSVLHPVVGLDRRANAALARMLADHAHERWAARRPVSPELWRCIGPFAGGALLDDLARVLATGSPPERAAALLALRASPDPHAKRLIDEHAALRDDLAARRIDWSTVLAYN